MPAGNRPSARPLSLLLISNYTLRLLRKLGKRKLQEVIEIQPRDIFSTQTGVPINLVKYHCLQILLCLVNLTPIDLQLRIE